MRISDWSSDVCSSDLVDGLRKERVKPVLELAVRRFNAFARLQSELDEARTALSDRKIIDRAKSILMSQRGLGEPEAYALLRRSEEHTSELQSLMRISYAVFCLKKKNTT